MGISDLLGKRQPVTDGNPAITGILPPAALPGGEVKITGRALSSRAHPFVRPRVSFASAEARLVVSSEDYVIARVPEDALSGSITVAPSPELTAVNPYDFKVAVEIADEVNPVANPAVDSEGNIYTTLSGPRGEETPASVYKIDTGSISALMLPAS